MVNHQPGRLERRTVLTGVAVGGVALPLLAACGASKAPTVASGTPLVKASEVPVGGGVLIAAKDVVVTQPTSGAFKCFSATCTHAGCQVNKQISDGVISCPCHGSEFSITDGSVQAGPAPKPLPEFTVHVSGGEVVRG